MSTLLSGGYILTLDDNDQVISRGDILVDGDEILSIGPDLSTDYAAGTQKIDASGCLVCPGLINGHTQSLLTQFKGFAENQPLPILQELIRQNLKDELSPDLAENLAINNAQEMIKTGVTTIIDHVSVASGSHDSLLKSLIRGYKAKQIRVTLAVTLVAAESESDETLKALSNAYSQICETYNSSSSLVKVAPAPFLEELMDPHFLTSIKKTAKQYKTLIYVSLNQTKTDYLKAQKHTAGVGPIQKLHNLGVLDDSFVFTHAVWVDQNDIEMIAASKSMVVHTPLTDLYTGSGLMPLTQFLEAGVNVGIGSDFASGDQSLFSAMKMAASIHRVAQPDYDRWPTEVQVLAMATRGGSKISGNAQSLGQLAVGKKADIVLYDLNSFSFSPLNVVKSQLVCLENGSSVRTVMIAGEIVYQDQKFINQSETKLQLEPLAKTEKSQSELKEIELIKVQMMKDIQAPASINRWANSQTNPDQMDTVERI